MQRETDYTLREKYREGQRQGKRNRLRTERKAEIAED